MELSEIFKKYPDFQTWTQNKKLNNKDITILTEFSDLNMIEEVLKWIVKNQPSHSQGQQILELSGELLLSNKPIDNLLEKELGSKQLISELKNLRYPLSSKKDKEQAELVDNLPFPPSIKARWIRQNDRTALEISFKSFSEKDWNQKIKSLADMKEQLQSLWNES